MSLDHLRHSIDSSLCPESDSAEKRAEIMDNISSVFTSRERTLQDLLHLYEKMYDDLQSIFQMELGEYPIFNSATLLLRLAEGLRV